MGASRFDGYLKEITREGERAWSRYGLLVIAGLELTYEADDGEDSAHAVALGFREHVAVEPPFDRALRRAGAAGAALIAAHPDDADGDASGRSTRALARQPALRRLVHRFELFTRTTMFGWVAGSGLPPSRPATSTAPGTSTAGRRSCPAQRARDHHCVPPLVRGRCTSRGSRPHFPAAA